jgi:hypothetical protein
MKACADNACFGRLRDHMHVGACTVLGVVYAYAGWKRAVRRVLFCSRHHAMALASSAQARHYIVRLHGAKAAVFLCVVHVICIVRGRWGRRCGPKVSAELYK